MDFVFCHDGGNVSGFVGADRVCGALQFDFQDMPIQEQDSAQRLIPLAPNARTVWLEAESF